MRSVLGLLLLLSTATAAAPRDAFPDVARAYLIEIDGEERWAGSADEALPIASLTKLMTALLVVEEGSLDGLLTVTATAAAETGSRLGLRKGDRVRRSDLLAATLIRSANDACRALADGIAGSERAFVERMNRRAHEIGMARSRFANACGHDDEDNRSSVRDLVRLTRAALAHEAIATRVAQSGHAFVSEQGHRFRFRNTNALLGSLAGARGVKTGWTPQAGRCLIALVEREGREVLAVLLHAPDRWWDAVGLIELAFDRAGDGQR